jgi:hypothetical protein
MTTGVLIFAFNNDQIDYLAMAAWSAKNIHRHLNLPVCVVTDCEKIPAHYEFDQVVNTAHRDPSYRFFGDIEGVVHWYNANRIDAYALSPWDQTLVLDADYIVASDQLSALLEINQDFLAHQRAYDITGVQTFDDLNRFGQYHMPMWWATVMLFRRSQSAELIFNSMTMIYNNWLHYRNLYQNFKPTYRNDHALSIALGMVNGHTLNHAAIPWDLASLIAGSQITELDQDQYRIDYTTPQKQKRWIKLVNQDFHAMGKTQLGAIVANHS